MGDVAEFVRSTFGDGERADKIRKSFVEHDVDGELLTSLETDDLTTDLGMSKLQARKFKRALDKLIANPADETTKEEKTSDDKKDADNEEKETASDASPKKEESSARTTEGKDSSKVHDKTASTATSSAFSEKWHGHCTEHCKEQLNDLKYQPVPETLEDGKHFHDIVYE